jgi:predicted dehydrogenase
MQSPKRRRPSRRQFLQTSTAAAASLAAAELVIRENAHAQGVNQTLKVGLIGCGGRGTGAASQALRADPNVKLWAMGDAFSDRLEQSLAGLQRDKEIAAKIDVPPERRFTGFDAYRQVIDSVDVALLATPPGFRPIHLRYAVERGKHVFAEKPCAVDSPGVRSVLQSAEEARKRGLSLVAGLQLRYSNSHGEIVRRIHDGALGQLHMLQANDFRGSIWVRPRQPDWTDMTYQMRNWYYFVWLCGDFNVEQHVHMLDLCSWVKNGYPVRSYGSGGRAVRNGPDHGHIFDHFAIIYEYEDGSKLFAQCRQSTGCKNDISVWAAGTKGRADVHGRRIAISGENEWRFDGRENSAVQAEHDALFASIRNGRPINNGEYLARSTLVAIMGRMAAYTGQQITWEQAMNSKEDLSPPRYDWNVPLPVPEVARPGITRFA